MSFNIKQRVNRRVRKHIQSIIFLRTKWTKQKAINWLIEHNHKHNKVHITKNFYRFRQYEPIMGEKYRLIKLAKLQGIKYVIAIR